MQAVIGRGSREKLRSLITENPLWATVFLVDQISEFIQAAESGQRPIDLDEYQQAANLLSAAILACPQERAREAYLIPSLEAGLSYLKDLIFNDRSPSGGGYQTSDS